MKSIDTLYVVRDKNTLKLWRGYGTTATPKLYTLGSAKGVSTKAKSKGRNLEVVPVTLTFGEPIKW